MGSQMLERWLRQVRTSLSRGDHVKVPRQEAFSAILALAPQKENRHEVIPGAKYNNAQDNKGRNELTSTIGS